MRITGVDTKKLTKTKAVLIVKFLIPQSLKDSTMQMYFTILEPQRSLGQGADLSILTAIKYASIRPNFLSTLRGDFLGVFLPNEDLLTVSSIVVR